MHEFGIVRHIFEEIQSTGKTRKAVVHIGALKSVKPEIFHQMFGQLAEGTELQDMEIKVITVPLVIECECGFHGEIRDVPHLHSVFVTWPCPECGKDAEIISGNEEEIKVE